MEITFKKNRRDMSLLAAAFLEQLFNRLSSERRKTVVAGKKMFIRGSQSIPPGTDGIARCSFSVEVEDGSSLQFAVRGVGWIKAISNTSNCGQGSGRLKRPHSGQPNIAKGKS
jgi:hypothetical protein